MKSFITASSLVAALSLFSDSAFAQPTISSVFPNGSYQFQQTNALTFTAGSLAGIANVSVTLTATTLFGVQGFPQTLTSSSGLTVSGSADDETVKAPLVSNVLYTATIVATDVNSLSSTDTVSFDTISPAYTWEARDWDYTANSVSGLFIDNPQTNAYAGLASTAGSDFYSGNPGSGSSSYRPQGLETESCSDTTRLAYSPYTTNQDYDVGYNNGGNWADYTRHYPPGSYNVFVRASDGNGAQSDAGDIEVVSGAASFPAGTNYFSTKSTGWQTYGWYPLINNTSNNPAVLTIPNDGMASTLRMTIDGGNCNENFFMLLPVNTNAPIGGAAYVTNDFPNGAYQFQQTNTFNCTIDSTNGLMTIVAQVAGSPLSGTPFQQTLTPSSGLTITGSSTSENVSFALTTDTVYSVTFLMTDGAGNNSSATITFDTVNPNYYTWEAEDYDYGGGNFFDNPQTNAYYGLAGEASVDAYCPGGPVNANAYERGVGPVYANDLGDLNVEANGDVPRLAYLNTTNPIFGIPYIDYDVGFTAGGQWGNYTRDFPAGIYNIYVRASDGGNASSDAGTISLVTGGYKTTSQTLSQLGSFNVPATGNWQAYQWCPVLNAAGYPARFTGSNDVPQTIRMNLVNASCNLNYYMLVPANLNNNPPPFVGNFSPDSSALFQPSNEVTFTANSSVGITASGITLYLSGVKQSNLTFSGNGFTVNVTCPIQTNQLYQAVITLSDAVGHTSYTNTFATYSASDYQFEAEDYDYTSNGVPGLFVDNPQTNAYLGMGSTAGIDNYQSDLTAQPFDYRANNDPGAAPSTTASGDLPRSQFALGGTDYNIGFFGGSSWANYTRHYPAGVYNVVGRFAEGAAVSHAILSVLTSGYGTTNQATNFLGTFTVPLGGWSSWEWAPLLDSEGNLVQVTLNGGQQTLKLGGSPDAGDPEVNVNFLMLVPANTNVPTITGIYPNGTNMLQYASALTFAVNSSLGVATNSIIVTVDGVVVSNLVFTSTATGWTVSYPGLQANASHTVNIQVTDADGNVATSTVTFNDYNPANYQWEAEDYDYTSNGVPGLYVDNPQVDAYANLGSTPGIDNYQSDLGANPFDYRPNDDPGPAPATTPSGDESRSQFGAGETDYNIGFFGAPSWANYTRHYPLGTYNILGRFAEGATGGSSATLAKVTAGFGTTNQSTRELGTFIIPEAGWSTWEFVEMTNGGSPASVTFDGTQTTLKLEGGSPNEANINFFMLVPAAPAPPITPALSAGKVTLSFVIQSGYTYELQYKTHLTDPTWAQVPGTVVMTGNMVTNVSDTIGSNGMRFYRLLIQSAP
ncbi:MAG TPA: carbohydrate-binding protein [Candidatus Sulfotelmatobacter sp.]|nr:carbohydrate-binding protein [Candidatus Sulfotelmatobacter sp.]